LNLLLLVQGDFEFLEGLLGSLPGYRIYREPSDQEQIDCVIFAGRREHSTLPRWWQEQLDGENPVLIVADSHSSLPHIPASKISKDTLSLAISWAKQHRSWRIKEERSLERNRQILAQVTHELRSPLSVISLATQLAMRSGADPQKLREHLSMVRESTRSLQTLVNDILDYSKMRSGTLQLSSTEFELEEFLQNVYQSYRLLAEEKGLEFRFFMDTRLPGRLVGDPGRLRQILANLLSNAVKFTSHGVVCLSVRLRSKSLTQVVPEFSIRDSGVGISTGALQRIFQPYEQAEESTFHQFGGTGLGLSIARSLVEQMGGEIQVQSQLSEGTEFTFSVKLGRVRGAAKRLVPEGSLQGVPVLIVQPPGASRSELRARLAENGMRIWTAGSRQEVLRLLPVVRNGVVLIHLDSFGFDEVETLRPLLPDRAKIVLLATTGQRGDGARGQALGVGAYLSGEFSPEELSQALMLTLSGAYTLVTRHTLRERRNPVHA